MDATLLYDASCGFCDRNVDRLRRLAGRPVERLPSDSEAARRLVPGLDPDRTDRQMLLVVGGRVYGGAEAVARVLLLNPWLRPLGWLYYVPGLRQTAEAVYRQIAARRHRLGACPLPPAGKGQ